MVADSKVDTGADNVYNFKVQYTQGGTTVTDNITLNITDKAVATSGPVAGAAALTVEEGDCIKVIQSILQTTEQQELVYFLTSSRSSLQLMQVCSLLKRRWHCFR